jgi:hypothetical protein
MTIKDLTSPRKLKVLDLLVFVALVAVGLTLSRSYFLEKLHETQMRTRMMRAATLTASVVEEQTISDWWRGPVVFYDCLGIANSSLVVCGFGVFFLQAARSRTTLRALVCQPGAAASLCCVTVVLEHFIPGLVWWTTRVAQRGVFTPLWTSTMSIVEAEVRGAVLAVWLVLSLSRCIRFHWSFFEIVGVVLGFVWMVQILALAIRQAFY